MTYLMNANEFLFWIKGFTAGKDKLSKDEVQHILSLLEGVTKAEPTYYPPYSYTTTPGKFDVTCSSEDENFPDFFTKEGRKI